MITGDTAEAAQKTAGQCGIEEFYHSMLPQDKVEHMLKVKSETGLTAFVGDGINDAPVLAAADIGVAMGFGSDAAIESADVVLSSGNLERIPDVIRLSRRTMNLITFNTIFALVVKAAVLVLGAFGLAAMWMAVFADVGVSILSVLNASRLLAVKANRPTADSYPR